MRKVGVLPCSGSCNVGMMSTKAVVEVCGDRENAGFVCALGLPLGIESIIANAKVFERNISVNGCEVRCATRSLEKVGLAVDQEFILTRDFGLKKSKALKDENGLDGVVHALDSAVDRLS